MTQMGLPLDAYALVELESIVLSTRFTHLLTLLGDLVASVCISQMEGELDHEIFNQEEAKKAA